jgi:hypothetical protein
LSVSEISKNINKDINLKQTQSFTQIKKRSQSYSHLGINKFTEDNNKIKVKSQNELFFNLDLQPVEIPKVVELNENEKRSVKNNKITFKEEIIKNNFTEFMNNKSNRFDLSIISEKEDLNTSLSFMDQNKENKIKEFILSTIKEIKSISQGQMVQKSISLKEDKIHTDNLLKQSFLKNKRQMQAENKIENDDKFKDREDCNMLNSIIEPTISELSENPNQKISPNIESELNPTTLENPKIENSIEIIEVNVTKSSINEEILSPVNSSPQDSNEIKISIESLCTNINNQVEPEKIEVGNPLDRHADTEPEFTKGAGETECVYLYDNYIQNEDKISGETEKENQNKNDIRNTINNEKENVKELIEDDKQERGLEVENLNELKDNTLNLGIYYKRINFLFNIFKRIITKN